MVACKRYPDIIQAGRRKQMALRASMETAQLEGRLTNTKPEEEVGLACYHENMVIFALNLRVFGG